MKFILLLRTYYFWDFHALRPPELMVVHQNFMTILASPNEKMTWVIFISRLLTVNMVALLWLKSRQGQADSMGPVQRHSGIFTGDTNALVVPKSCGFKCRGEQITLFDRSNTGRLILETSVGRLKYVEQRNYTHKKMFQLVVDAKVRFLVILSIIWPCDAGILRSTNNNSD
jgi:hypothetical protein